MAVVEENRGKGRDRGNENSIVCLEKRHAVDDFLSLSLQMAVVVVDWN